MKKLLTILAAVAAIGFATPSQADFSPISLFNPFRSAQPHVVAKISLSRQSMELVVVTGRGDARTYNWKVSTGRTGFDTPTGAFKPTWLSKNHKSKTYDDAPMPFSVFFTGGYAVHGTDAISRLGSRASHGCVRLATQNAAMFFQLVSTYGKWNTRIVITD